jgi:hypothetical protein
MAAPECRPVDPVVVPSEAPWHQGVPDVALGVEPGGSTGDQLLIRILYSSGRTIGRCDRLAADCCALQPIGTNSAFARLQLNRAVAIAMRDGPGACLTHTDAVWEHGELANYYRAQSARADMYRRLGRTAEARSSYEKALVLTQHEPERQFLQERIRRLK